MEFDSDHAAIERIKKNTQMRINHLNDWMQLIRIARVKNPFNVIKMEKENFYDFSSLSKKDGPFMIKKIIDSGEKFLWHPIQWLQYKNSEGKIYFKLSLEEDEDFKVVTYQRRGRHFKPFSLPLINESTVPISEAKKRDLMDLLPLIDTAFHDFYKNIKTNNSDPIDPDLEVFNPDDDSD